ncbi:hypothetical protein EMIT0324P_20194 [Pseudomonas chlororaphis]
MNFWAVPFDLSNIITDIGKRLTYKKPAADLPGISSKSKLGNRLFMSHSQTFHCPPHTSIDSLGYHNISDNV